MVVCYLRVYVWIVLLNNVFFCVK